MLQQNRINKQKMTFALLLVYLAVHVIYTKIVIKIFDMPMHLSVTLQLTSYIVLGGVGIVLFLEKIKEGVKSWKEQPIPNILFFFGAFLLDILLSNLAYLPIMLLNPEYESINQHSVAELQGQIPALFLIIALGIMGPATEEVVFRLLPVCFLEKKKLQVIGIITTSILFMLIHVQAFTLEEFYYYLPMFVTGIIYGMVTVISRNATIPILLHILNNLPTLLLLNNPGRMNPFQP